MRNSYLDPLRHIIADGQPHPIRADDDIVEGFLDYLDLASLLDLISPNQFQSLEISKHPFNGTHIAHLRIC